MSRTFMPAEPRGGGMRRLIAVLIVLALSVFGAAAQEADPFLADLDQTLDGAEETLGGGLMEAEGIEVLRERLLRLRGELAAYQRGVSEPLAEAEARLGQLGPVPEEGASEPDDLSDRRAALGQAVAEARLPVLEVEEAQVRLEAVLETIERALWEQLATELATRGPSPLSPRTWQEAEAALAAARDRGVTTLETLGADPARRADLIWRLPLTLALLAVAVTATIVLRRWLTARVERGLVAAREPRQVAWLVALRNASRLILPVVAAGLVFAALSPEALAGRPEALMLFDLPGFVLALIGAGWLASSLYAPRLAAFRLVPVSDAEAARGAGLIWVLGVALAAHLAIAGAARLWGLAPSPRAVLSFPVIVVAALALWRHAALISALAARAPGEAAADGVGLLLTRLLGRALLAVAVAAPVLAAAGYLAAAERLIFPAILTVGLIGACVVVFDLLAKTWGSLAGAKAGEGLGPVVIATALVLAAAPLLALIWGARGSDLARGWAVLRDGVSLGGIHLSLGNVATFAVVFGLVYGATRMLQSLLRVSVLPRTRMDAGGRNAVLAGVGYVGFFVAALAAISSTGIDLSSIAIVAGALSVGIGFGLQNVVSNFVSGIILLVERPIKEGDWIEVGGHSGYVSGISVRSTVIETFDKASVIVPNSDLVAGTVLNWTHSGMSGRLRVPVSVGYDSDARAVEAVLLAVAEAHPAVLLTPEPRVLFMGFGADALDFEIRCWLRDVNLTLSARSDMNFEILARFRAAGIEIPFPQRDLHLRGTGDLAAVLGGEGRAAGA